MPSDSAPPPPLGYRWSMPGDINAFFGLSLDNLADLTLTVSLLATVFGFPLGFARLAGRRRSG